MRAAVLHGPEDVRVEEVAEPAGEVLVEVLAATTCGTDVKMWRHGHRVLPPYPCLFGHETAGRRVDTGEHVLVSDSVACGNCPPCRSGRPQICRSPTWVLGGFAQRIAPPKAALHRIPDGLPPEGAAMAEPLAAAVHAIARGSDAGYAGVLGGGSIGLMLAGLLVREGRSVLVADRHQQRRDQAAALGARAADKLLRHDLVFEAVGRPDAWRAAVSSAAPGGVVVFVGGCPAGTEVSFPAAPIHYDELDLRGTFHHAPAEVDSALRVLAQDGFPWRLLLGERIGLDDLPRALRAPGGGRARKFVIDPAA